jgi:hypothetical protein
MEDPKTIAILFKSILKFMLITCINLPKKNGLYSRRYIENIIRKYQ